MARARGVRHGRRGGAGAGRHALRARQGGAPPDGRGARGAGQGGAPGGAALEPRRASRPAASRPGPRRRCSRPGRHPGRRSWCRSATGGCWCRRSRSTAGAALIMAADLAGTPRSGITTQLCGDAHLMNFGVFGSPERRLVFGINDFDETFPGPWEWDVKRLAASFAIAGRDNGYTAKERKKVLLACSAGTARRMREFAAMTQPRRLVRPPRRRRHPQAARRPSPDRRSASGRRPTSPRPAPETACRPSTSSPTSSTASAASSATRRSSNRSRSSSSGIEREAVDGLDAHVAPQLPA